MFYYRLYGLLVESNIEFPQLLEYQEDGENSVAQIAIEVSKDLGLKDKGDLAPISDGAGWGFTENGMWFDNQAGTFLLETKDGVSRMSCDKLEGIPDAMVRSFLLGNCIAIIMTQRKKIVLHGSTVVIGDKTVLVCGDSGTGKSTLAMSLIDKGGKLLADDISVLDADENDGCIYAYPGFPEQKLCRDAAADNGFNLDELTYIDEERDKFSVDRRDIFIDDIRKVDALISLHTVSEDMAGDDFDEGVRILKVVGASKVNAITDRFFLNWLYEKAFRLEPSEMMKCVGLAGQIEIFDVTRVRQMDTREHMTDRILSELGV